MGEYVRIAVGSGSAPAGTDAATKVLLRRLSQFAGRSEAWGAVWEEPRPGAPVTQGPVTDVLVEFARDQLAPAAVAAAVSQLVRAIIGHFRTQPDETQTTTLTVGERSVVLRADGMSAEELARLERLVAGWLLGREG